MQVITQPVHRQPGVGVIFTDIALRLLHQPFGGGDPALIHAAAHVEADRQQPGPEILHGGILCEETQPCPPGSQHGFLPQPAPLDNGQQSPQHANGFGLAAPLPVAVRQEFVHHGGDLLLGTELDDREELLLPVGISLRRRPVQTLHILYVDGLSSPHHRTVLQGGPGLSTGTA